jgi:uncharacterized protein (TIGR03067 family)
MIPLLLAIPLVAAAPVPKELRREKPALDGTWELKEYHFDKARVIAVKQTWVIAAGKFTLDQTESGNGLVPLPVTLDVTATPMRIDFDNGSNAKGVFEVTKDALILCMSSGGAERPTDLTPGRNRVKYVFTRKPPAK